jgi:hypothetical protein
VRETGERLVVVVEDDGQGGANMDGGTGLRGLVDRVAALEGSLAVDRPPGGGTRLRAELPLSPQTVSDTSAVWARERCVPRCQTPGAGLEPVSDTVKVGAVSDTLKGEFSAAVDQGQSADDSTSPAATGLSSMYRTAA